MIASGLIHRLAVKVIVPYHADECSTLEFFGEIKLDLVVAYVTAYRGDDVSRMTGNMTGL